MNAIATPPRAERPGPAACAELVSDSLVIARRSLAHIRQIPEKLLDVTLQPLMFVLLFAFVFGGVIAIPGGSDYHEYLIGGILVQTLAFGIIGPGDLDGDRPAAKGILDRFRSLPMHRSAFLLGHLIAEFARLGAGDRDDGHQRPDRRLADPERRAPCARRLRPARAARGDDAVARHAARRARPLSRRRHGHRLPDGLPADLRRRRRSCRSRACPTGCASSPNTTRSAAGRRRCGHCSATRPRRPCDAAWPLEHPVVASLLWCVALIARRRAR